MNWNLDQIPTPRAESDTDAGVTLRTTAEDMCALLRSRWQEDKAADLIETLLAKVATLEARLRTQASGTVVDDAMVERLARHRAEKHWDRWASPTPESVAHYGQVMWPYYAEEARLDLQAALPTRSPSTPADAPRGSESGLSLSRKELGEGIKKAFPDLDDFECEASAETVWADCLRIEYEREQAALSCPAEPSVAGWRLAPEEPTEAMMRAGSKAYWGAPSCEDDQDMGIAWNAMLAAIPTPPQEVGL